MPVNGAGMLKSPVDGNPPRQPGVEPNFLRPRRVTPDIEDVEVLPGKDVSIAVEKRAPQVFRQGFERAAVLDVVGGNGVVIDARADEVVVARIVQIPTLEARRGLLIDPQRFDPGVTDVSGIRSGRHVAEASRHTTAIAGC